MSENNAQPTKTRADHGGPESTRGGYSFTPRVDIYESDNELTLYADVPGVKSENVDLRYERGELLLHARIPKKPFPSTLSLHEYEVGDFYRVFHIHESIDASGISAECKNGVLTVHLPKSESVKPRQVKVSGE